MILDTFARIGINRDASVPRLISFIKNSHVVKLSQVATLVSSYTSDSLLKRLPYLQ